MKLRDYDTTNKESVTPAQHRQYRDREGGKQIKCKVPIKHLRFTNHDA